MSFATTPRPGMGQRLLSGVLAGVVGTAALSAFERLEQALLGRAPIYASSAIGRALTRQAGLACSRVGARRAGLVLRWLYGPALGGVYAVRASREPRSRLRSGLRLGSAIYLFELVAMPAVGATKPVREWTPLEVVLLFCHASAFALVTAATLGRSEALFRGGDDV